MGISIEKNLPYETVAEWAATTILNAFGEIKRQIQAFQTDHYCKFGDPRIIGWFTGGNLMKANIHPNYVDAIVKCACGETFKTRSTRPEIHLEICSKCHPFFTGKQKLVDTAGRVERFQRKYKKKA